MRRVPGSMAILLLCGLLGCAGARPPGELVGARQSYDRARARGAAALVPADLHEARVALDRAERADARDPGSNEARGWAYIAGRKAERAEALAGVAAAERRRAAAVEAHGEAQAALVRELSERQVRAEALSQAEEQLLRSRERSGAQEEARSLRQRELLAAR